MIPQSLTTCDLSGLEHDHGLPVADGLRELALRAGAVSVAHVEHLLRMLLLLLTLRSGRLGRGPVQDISRDSTKTT